ncbi:CMP-N,N'-diacetyllegionaminic acid synthase [Methylomarinovum tepidoasis]|uniref:CMP-N,N'-diacetyllegionaminic acid synthase n=1 Tax=Methylomarinovum tepidoasis TaxID=2840183 RepID=A0AAU9BYZ0_9GAMM|nr:acylneuraminate cytidylyltransferase family protein [Methylomarinovum sp. IN45]BCX88985.1 CMP-N,N'-diacetyllegionaminic acid synthase [Methylomarinovum sp. IN45]
MWKGHSVLAVVPARGGSKGIPGKNLREVGGRSLIGWTGWLIDQIPWIDQALLSTDDPALAEEGRRSGLAVPFLRPPELATDTALGIDVWRHAWLAAEAHWRRQFDLAVYLQPTTPLRRPEHIEKTVEALSAGNFEAATTIAPVPGHFVPEKILRLDESGCVRPYLDKSLSNRQQAPRYYYRTGACYAAWRDTIVTKRRIVEGNCAGVVIETPTANIDDPIDLDFAEFLYQKHYR